MSGNRFAFSQEGEGKVKSTENVNVLVSLKVGSQKRRPRQKVPLSVFIPST